ncbi:hypothetical protein ANN_05861 [Periplaneta americana]|uniref:Uncharacterized protein n=1 Tax=Periplaneta americana TaxID=6978 RepID=A0ABQ8TBZ0_PERAM|nr:hypothetical protein ANN_05861 [Periplaneta americana]
MSPGSSTESYPAFAHIGLRENPGKNLNQVTCPDRESNPGYLTVTPQGTHTTGLWNYQYQLLRNIVPVGHLYYRILELSISVAAQYRSVGHPYYRTLELRYQLLRNIVPVGHLRYRLWNYRYQLLRNIVPVGHLYYRTLELRYQLLRNIIPVGHLCYRALELPISGTYTTELWNYRYQLLRNIVPVGHLYYRTLELRYQLLRNIVPVGHLYYRTLELPISVTAQYRSCRAPILQDSGTADISWDPYRQNQIDSIEKVQRKAAKYVKMGKGHGEKIVKDLGWELLKSRRRKTRLTALFKAQMGHKAWTDINARLATPSYLGRTDHIRSLNVENKERTWQNFLLLTAQ